LLWCVALREKEYSLNTSQSLRINNPKVQHTFSVFPYQLLPVNCYLPKLLA